MCVWPSPGSLTVASQGPWCFGRCSALSCPQAAAEAARGSGAEALCPQIPLYRALLSPETVGVMVVCGVAHEPGESHGKRMHHRA